MQPTCLYSLIVLAEGSVSCSRDQVSAGNNCFGSPRISPFPQKNTLICKK